MEDSGRYVAINATLRRLEQYSTLSPFCRAFYRLIYELLGDPEMDSAKLRQAFHVFLRCECRRHQTVCRIVRDGNLDLEKIIRSGRQTHDLLEWLTRSLRQMNCGAPQQETVRQLLLAECDYHLGHTTEVVHATAARAAAGMRPSARPFRARIQPLHRRGGEIHARGRPQGDRGRQEPGGVPERLPPGDLRLRAGPRARRLRRRRFTGGWA